MGKKDKVEVILKRDLYLTTPKRKKNTITAIIEYTGPIQAPIKKDEKLGILKVYISDELKEEIDIYANEDIARLNIFSRIIKSFNFLVWGDV